MAEMTYVLNFGGYWRVLALTRLPTAAGIYGVYACTYNALTDRVSLHRLLYVGEAANVRNRVAGHEQWTVWTSYLLPAEELCFNGAMIAPVGARHRAEAAMIHHHKPPCNSEYVNSFPFDATTTFTSGRRDLLTPVFTVRRAPGETLLPSSPRWRGSSHAGSGR